MNRSRLTLLLACWTLNAAHAMGLGELSVRSPLGQPFDATIQLIDAPANLNADCFSVRHAEGNLPALQNVRLALEQRGTRNQLRLTSPHTLNEPVAEFVLTSDCESRLQRHYVALIDPMPLNEINGETLPAERALPRAVDRAPSAIASTPRAPARKAARKRALQPRQAAAPSTPRLVLSGKRHTDRGNAAFALRFDTNLPDLNRPREEPLTADELSDENTALTRKLTHLEAQLAELARKNAALDAEQAATSRKPTTTAPAPVAPATPARWPLYLLGLAAGLAGCAALVVWLRRRSQARAEAFGTPLFDEALPADDHASELEEIPTRQSVATAVAATQPAPQSAPEYQYGIETQQDQGTEVKEDLLDQAEVFMAHGHSDLAVHLLKEHLQKAPTESPVPWLLLLDLLHRQGNEAEYAAAGDECRRYYNVNLSGHPISQDGEPPGPGLENYPHVLERLTGMWNTPELESFLHEMIHDSRGGTRMGFDPGAYRELLLLHDIAKDLKAA